MPFNDTLLKGVFFLNMTMEIRLIIAKTLSLLGFYRIKADLYLVILMYN